MIGCRRIVTWTQLSPTTRMTVISVFLPYFEIESRNWITSSNTAKTADFYPVFAFLFLLCLSVVTNGLNLNYFFFNTRDAEKNTNPSAVRRGLNFCFWVWSTWLTHPACCVHWEMLGCVPFQGTDPNWPQTALLQSWGHFQSAYLRERLLYLDTYD